MERLAVSDREADRDRPAHRATSLYIISTQPEQRVIGFMGRTQKTAMTVVGEPITDVDHPHRGQGYG